MKRSTEVNNRVVENNKTVEILKFRKQRVGKEIQRMLVIVEGGS